jgi:hypothetical protein
MPTRGHHEYRTGVPINLCISDEFENKLDQIDEESAYLDAIDDDDL